jgi:hypothetical protein
MMSPDWLLEDFPFHRPGRLLPVPTTKLNPTLRESAVPLSFLRLERWYCRH